MRISHAAERTRRALWVMYTRLTSTRLHKFYTLTLLLTLLPLIILHLLALSNTTTALNKLSLLLATTNSTNANSVVPTVTDQNGQGILQLCNVGRSDCQTVTSVAPTETATPILTSTPQQVNTVPVNAGVAPTNSASATPVPDVAAQPGGARPASPASPISSQSGSSPPSPPPPPPTNSAPPPSQGSDGGVLIAAPPTQTQTQPISTSTSSSSTSAGVFIADAPSTTPTSSTSTSEKSGGGNSGKDSGNGKNNGNGKDTSTETSKTSKLTLPPLITLLNPGESTTSSEISSTTSATTSESSSSSTTSAEPETKTEKETSVISSTTESSIPATTTTTTTSATSSTTSQESSASSTSTDSTLATSSTATEPPTPTQSSSSQETGSKEKETSAPAVGKDVSVKDVTLSSTGTETVTRAVPSLVRPEFESSTVLPSSSLSTTVASTSSTASPISSSSSPPSSSSSADETKDTQKEAVTDLDKQGSTSSSRTKESSTPTPTTTSSASTSTSELQSESTSTEIKNGQAQATSTDAKGALPVRAIPVLPLRARAFSATPITNSTTGALSGIDVTDVDDTGGTEVTRLGVVCAIAMAFPRDQLQEEWMENLTMAAFYLGMLGVGIAAILNESVAHLITTSLSILLSLLWTGTQLVRTRYVHDQFDAFITRGACSGIDVLPSYWAQRTRLELPILIINALALLLLGVLGVQLLKRYHREVGSGRGVERYVYKVVVVLRCAVLLGGFLLVASMGVWVHLLFTNAGVVGASGVDLLNALGIVSLVFVAPWGVLGWLALNAATPSTSGAYNGGSGKWGRWWGKRTMMGFFCGLNVLFLGGWIATFASDVYRAVFLAWTFFAVLSIAGFFVLMGSLGTGVVCWMRFARDLQDFDSEKPASDIMSRPFSTASIDPFGVRPNSHSYSHSGQSHSHIHGGAGVGVNGSGGGPDSLRWDYSNTAEKAWEPFDKASIRQSQFTASEGRQSTVFSYGLRSPAPPMPTRPEYGSSNNSNVSLGLAL